MALSRNLANSAVALAAELGSRNVEMSGTPMLIIHGPRAFRLAKVGHGDADFCDAHCARNYEYRSHIVS